MIKDSYYRQRNYRETLEQYNGSMHCHCDHGCNQWLDANGPKVGLITDCLAVGDHETANILARIPGKRLWPLWLERQRYISDIYKQYMDPVDRETLRDNWDSIIDSIYIEFERGLKLYLNERKKRKEWGRERLGSRS